MANLRWYRTLGVPEVGRSLQTIRRDRGTTQQAFAPLVHSSSSTISRLERGEDVSLRVALDAAIELGYEFILVPKGSAITVTPPEE